MGPIQVANCSPRVGSVVDPVATKCAIHNVATLSTSPRGHVAPRVQTMWPTRQPRGPNPRGTLATVGNVVCNDVANCGHVYKATWLTVGHMSENHVADCGHVDHNPCGHSRPRVQDHVANWFSDMWQTYPVSSATWQNAIFFPRKKIKNHNIQTLNPKPLNP
jgi:hypothetical protein